jgi:hypothetical protein
VIYNPLKATSNTSLQCDIVHVRANQSSKDFTSSNVLSTSPILLKEMHSFIFQFHDLVKVPIVK